MARFRLADRDGLFRLDLRTTLPASVLADERTEPVLAAALLMAVATLIEGGDWPTRALETMRDFMSEMHHEVNQQRHT
jgi:hypothetical protein